MADEEIAGMVVKLAMENGSFNEGIQDLNRKMKLVDSEFKAAVGGSKNFGDSLDGLKANSDRLSKSIEIQNGVVSKYQERLDSSKKTLDNNVESQLKLEAEINKVKQAYDSSAQSIGKESNETKTLKAELDKLQTSYDKNNEKIRNSQKAVDNNTISVNKAKEKLNKFNAELDENNKKLQDSKGATNESSSMFDKFKQSLGEGAEKTSLFGVNLGDLGSSLTSGGAATAVLGGAIAGLSMAFVQLATQAIQQAIVALGEFVKESLKVGIEVEAQMSRVVAIAGATGDSVKMLNETAKEFGAETVFSTSEVAKSMEYMSMAGWDAQQTMSGLSGVLDLAAASGEDLARVSDITTDVLTAFGESAAESGRLADVLAAAATKSNTNVSKMGLTFQYAAPLAGALNYSMEDVAIATGLMANASIKGEKAGTALRTMFTELIGTIEISGDTLGKYIIETENADGTMKPLSTTIGSLREAFSQLTEAEKVQQAETLVGKEAMAGLLTIVNASEEDYNKLTNAINNSSGAAENMSSIMNDNVSGTMKSIGSKLESVKLSLYNFFEPIISSFSHVFDAIISVSADVFSVIGNIGNHIMTYLAVPLEISAGCWKVLGSVVKSVLDLFMELAGPIFESLSGQFDDLTDVISVFAQCFGDGMKAIVDFIRPVFDLLGELIGVTFSLLTGNIKGFIKGCEDIFDTLTGNANESGEKLKELNSKTEKNTSIHYETLEEMNKKHTETMEELSKTSQSYLEKEISTYEKKLRESYDETTRSGREAIKKRLENKRKELEEKYHMEEEHVKKIAQLNSRILSNVKSSSSNIPGYAVGTKFHTGGLALVGENGPELIRMNRGAQVMTNGHTQQILNSKGTGGQTYQMTGPITIQTNNAEDLFNQIQILARRGAFS